MAVFELGRIDFACKVNEGAGNRGAAESVDFGQVAFRNPDISDPESVPGADGAHRRNVNEVRWSSYEPVEMRCGQVREGCAGSEGEKCSPPLRPQTQTRVSERVDAAVHTVDAARVLPMANLIVAVSAVD